MSGIGLALRRVLPAGYDLSEETWTRRHRSIGFLLWAHVLVIPVYGLLRGGSIEHVILESGAVALFALGASERRLSRTIRASLATLGLVTSSALLTHFSDGLIEMHFHFFVMVVVVSLYQSWVPFLVALAYVVLHHGIFGALHPEAVFNHPSALAHPWRWALVHGFFILGQSAACLVAWRINEDALGRERTARRAFEQANRDLAKAQALSSIGSWDWEVATGTVWWSDELYKLAGVNPERFVPSVEAFLALLHPDDQFRVAVLLEHAQAKHTPINYEASLLRRDGETRVVHCLGQAILAEDGSLTRMIGTCQDITDRKALEDEVQHRALHDSLTGLANRTLFLDRVDHALAVHRRTRASLAVLFLDLDDFKTVNDSLGHGVGDALLGEIASRLSTAVRDSDTVARLGGDEFAVLLEETDLLGAEQMAQRIQRTIEAPLLLDGKELSPRVSLGIASVATSSTSADLLRDADIAMYVAKREGKGGYRLFSTDMLSSVITRMEIQGQLAAALERGQFVLHYQPVVDLRTGQVQSAEALVRWNHPERGMIPPQEFIGVAEENGFIVPLGRWVTQEAARHARRMQDALGRPFSIAVNVSPRQLSADIETEVASALHAARLDPRQLILEITETCVMGQTEEVTTKLGALRSLGVRVAIDDFGTGYSSLSYLRSLPIDVLKIDRSFVSCVTDGAEQSALAQAIVKLGRIFDLGIVAEGIETPEQATLLQEFGCSFGQGFLYSRPVPGDELVAIVVEREAGLAVVADPAHGFGQLTEPVDAQAGVDAVALVHAEQHRGDLLDR